MKKGIIAYVLVSFLSVYTIVGQEITGEWNGVLNIQGTQLRVVFNIKKTDSGYISTMDSPDQGAKGIPVATTTFEESVLKIKATAIGATYNGKLAEGIITGTFVQRGMSLPLILSRDKVEKQVLKRPQEPKTPFPYYSEEVIFKNTEANISLAGTLTLPKKEGKFPVVILITGSGPQDRNEELMGHKPFLVIADYFTKKGIAVLRYDDRGFGKSTGNFKTATSNDFALDVESAVAYLKTRKEVDKNKIGLVGHSEGGIIAPMVAAKSKDVDFIVLLAGTGIPGDELLLLQGELIERVSGKTEEQIKKSKQLRSKIFEMITKSKDIQVLKKDLHGYLVQFLKENMDELPKGISAEDFTKQQINQLTSPWMVNFIKHDPAKTLEKVKCAVLAVNGEKDLQVPPKENLTAIEASLKKGGNKKVTIIEFPKLNHLFQESETGAPSEYGTLEETFSEEALIQITSWILKQVE